MVAAGSVDFIAAAAPSPATMVELACGCGAVGLLLDTFQKDSGNLFAYITDEELSVLSRRLSAAGRFLALGGGLGPREVERVRDTGAAILGVRGAACEGGRGGVLAAARVRDLANRVFAMPVARG